MQKKERIFMQCNPVKDVTDDSALEDCNLTTYQEVTALYDLDGDGYLSDQIPQCVLDKIVSGEIESSFAVVAQINDGELDWNDNNNTIHPNAPELCDGLDNDGDGEVDEDPDPSSGTVYYSDSDHDGYGNLNEGLVACNQPNGYVQDFADCDDDSAAVNPSVAEECGNGTDDNCVPRDCRLEDGTLEDLSVISLQGTANVNIGTAIDSGNINGTGPNDIVVGVPYLDTVALLDGAANPSDIESSFRTITTQNPDDSFGHAVAVLPDLNNDGVPDLLISQTRDDTNANDAGRVVVVFGPFTTGGDVENFQSAEILGDDTDDRFGWIVRSVPDVDGDTRPDILVGAEDNSPFLNSGAVYLISGITMTNGQVSQASDAFAIFLGRQDYVIGHDAEVGDFIDGDGVDDLALPASVYSEVATTQGALFLTTISSGVFNPPYEYRILGEIEIANFANRIDGRADFNGDGYDDIWVGSPGNSSQVGAGAGAVYLFFGPISSDLQAGDASIKIYGSTNYATFGEDLVVANFDSDGIPDVFIGAPTDGIRDHEGQVFVFYGDGVLANGPGTFFDADASAFWLGSDANDFAGNAIVNLSDINGDGSDELAVGAPRADLGGTDGGAFFIILGGQ